ncbi:unnamed protein product, partial [Mesorhabditis spiculigera]
MRLLLRISLTLLSIGVVGINALEKRAIVPAAPAAKTSEIVEGSGSPNVQKYAGPDQETVVQGSGYPTDDEDDVVQGSGMPAVVEGSGAPAWQPVPVLTTTTTTTTAPPRQTDDDKKYIVGEEINLQTTPAVRRQEIFEIPRTTEIPVVKFEAVETREPPRLTSTVAPTTPRTTRRPAIPAAIPPRDDESTPFHHMLKPGVFAAIVGGAIVGLLATVFIIVFIVYRMRKKDEGSYALDEPKARPYAGYAYTKASTKEFYA